MYTHTHTYIHLSPSLPPTSPPPTLQNDWIDFQEFCLAVITARGL
uniref:Uncharacterized protein n=1 Tax=Anguilla anguilla TaxID=7936 RepID=A0A0E9SWM6_ANGAN